MASRNITITSNTSTHEVTVTQGTIDITITMNQLALVTGTFKRVDFTGDDTVMNISTEGTDTIRTNSEIVVIQQLFQHRGATLDYTIDSDLKGITFTKTISTGRKGFLYYVKG